MFERFTEQARQGVVYAQEEARALRRRYVGTEHLLLGIVRVDPSLLPVPIARARDAVKPGEDSTPEQVPFTPEALRALELALDAAPEPLLATPAHLLLGLLDADHTAAELIADFGLDPTRIRQHAQAVAGAVQLGDSAFPLGDLGNPRVDARLLLLMLRADTRMARFLRSKGVDEEAILEQVPHADEEWPA